MWNATPAKPARESRRRTKKGYDPFLSAMSQKGVVPLFRRRNRCPNTPRARRVPVCESWLEFDRGLMKYVLMTILVATSIFAASAVGGELTAAGPRSCE